MMRTAIAIALALGLGSTTVLAADGDGRYQFGGSDILRVIDSQTGAIWQAKSDGKGSYVMVPVLFQSVDGKSTTLTPALSADPHDPLGILGGRKSN